MLRKLCFILVLAIFLGGCGAAAPDSAQMNDAAVRSSERFETVADSSLALAESVETPAEEVCRVEYFTFRNTSNSVRNDEDMTVLLEKCAVADFVSDDPDRQAWIQGILADLDREYAAVSTNLLGYADEFLSLEGEEFFYSYSNYRQLGVARHDEAVISLLGLSSVFSGGSHPNSVQTAYNLDIDNRRILRLEDVIQESQAPALATMIQAEVEAKFNGFGLFEDYAETINTSMIYGSLTPYWYLNDMGLVIFYNQYELGPYASGIIKAQIPYDALDGILLEEFLPMAPDGERSDLFVVPTGEGGHIIPVTIQPEGQRLSVGVEGTVYQVQISEVFWLDATPISQELIFSARTLCQNDVLEITGGFDDETRSFAIEFIDGRGVQKVCYLHRDALTEEP